MRKAVWPQKAWRRFATTILQLRLPHAWHALQRKPARTLVPKNSISRSGLSSGNAPVNVLRGFGRTVQKSRTLSEKLKSATNKMTAGS